MILYASGVIMPTETRCCLKTKNGKEGSFVHDVGSDRFDMAYRSLNPINAIAETCGLLPAGEKLLYEVRRETLKNRGDKEWTRRNAEDLAARAIFGTTLTNDDKKKMWGENPLQL